MEQFKAILREAITQKCVELVLQEDAPIRINGQAGPLAFPVVKPVPKAWLEGILPKLLGSQYQEFQTAQKIKHRLPIPQVGDLEIVAVLLPKVSISFFFPPHGEALSQKLWGQLNPTTTPSVGTTPPVVSTQQAVPSSRGAAQSLPTSLFDAPSDESTPQPVVQPPASSPPPAQQQTPPSTGPFTMDSANLFEEQTSEPKILPQTKTYAATSFSMAEHSTPEEQDNFSAAQSAHSVQPQKKPSSPNLFDGLIQNYPDKDFLEPLEQKDLLTHDLTLRKELSPEQILAQEKQSQDYVEKIGIDFDAPTPPPKPKRQADSPVSSFGQFPDEWGKILNRTGIILLGGRPKTGKTKTLKSILSKVAQTSSVTGIFHPDDIIPDMAGLDVIKSTDSNAISRLQNTSSDILVVDAPHKGDFPAILDLAKEGRLVIVAIRSGSCLQLAERFFGDDRPLTHPTAVEQELILWIGEQLHSQNGSGSPSWNVFTNKQ